MVGVGCAGLALCTPSPPLHCLSLTTGERPLGGDGLLSSYPLAPWGPGEFGGGEGGCEL